MTAPVRVVFYSGFAILFLGILSPLFLEMLKPKSDLPELYAAPQFELPEARGTTLSSRELRGSVWLASFFLTSCKGPCPIQSANIARLSKRFSHDSNVKFLSFTVDPKNDSVEALLEYAKRYNAAPGVWHFLRPSTEELERILVEGFHLGTTEDPMAHATRFVLVDGHGVIRGYYHGTEDKSVEKLAEDIAALRRG